MRKEKYSKSAKTADNGKSIVVYKKTVLPNGVRILTEEVPSVESFALGICIDAGSREDPVGQKGAAHFVEHAVFLHTQKRSFRQIASMFESFGAYTNAFTTKEFTCFYVRSLKNHFTKSMDLLSDIVLNPIFQNKEVEREKSIILEEIRSYDDEAEEMIFDYADRQLFGEHGLGHPISGEVEDVIKIGSKELSEYHQKYYNGNNILISVAGNISHEAVVKATEQIFGALPADGEKTVRKEPDKVKPSTLELVKPYLQSHILFSRQVAGLNSENRYALAVLNVILGDGLSSRLNQKLREKHGLAYSVYSSLSMVQDTGVLYVYAATDKNRVRKTESLIAKEIAGFLDKRLPNTEVNRAKEQIKSSTIMALESMTTRMQSLAKSEYTLGYYEDIPMTIKEIDSVSKQDVENCAEYYFRMEDWNSVKFLPK